MFFIHGIRNIYLLFILQVDYPVINETLQIEDSDEEDDKENEQMIYIEEENLDIIDKELPDIVKKCLRLTNFENQFKKESEYLKNVVNQRLCKLQSKLQTNI